MSERKKLIFSLLEKRNFIKIDLSNFKDDTKLIQKLTYIYTLCECSAIDINYQYVYDVKKYLKLAIKNKCKMHEDKFVEPIIFASLYLDDLVKKKLDIIKIISNSTKEGADVIELHFEKFTLEQTLDILSKLKHALTNVILSLNISRKKLSNSSIIEIIKYAKNIVEKDLIIEVGTNYSSNNQNLSNISLQSISTADIINKLLISKEPRYRRLPILIADDINFKTSKLANSCEVKFNGITFSDFACKILSKNSLKEVNPDEAFFDEIKKIKSLIK